MKKKHRKHLKSRKSHPFNQSSKYQEDFAKKAADIVWDKILKKYPDLDFNNLNSLGIKDLDADYALSYMNRWFRMNKFKERDSKYLQSIQSSKGIKPDGGIFFVKSKIDGFDHIICALEVKHQGEYNGYTPISDSEWKKKKGDPSINKINRPPQAQGNAIERFAKNANAIRTLTSFYNYNPYVVMCEGFDFFLKSEFNIFKEQPYSSRFKNRDSSILMRLIAGNEWMPLNKIYVECMNYKNNSICPATIFARMRKWDVEEIVDLLLKVIDKSILHLKKMGEI